MKIVIVEDEIRIREGVEKLIKRIPKEYEMIVTAENGEEGLQIVLEHQPEIVITDIKMPKMDGIEMLSKLKALGKMPKVIVLSAYSEFEYARQAIKLGVSEYILKPISVIEFSNSFKSLCQQIRDEKEKENLMLKKESLEFIIEQELYYGNQRRKFQRFSNLMSILLVLRLKSYLEYDKIKKKFGVNILLQNVYFIL